DTPGPRRRSSARRRPPAPSSPLTILAEFPPRSPDRLSNRPPRLSIRATCCAGEVESTVGRNMLRYWRGSGLAGGRLGGWRLGGGGRVGRVTVGPAVPVGQHGLPAAPTSRSAPPTTGAAAPGAVRPAPV